MTALEDAQAVLEAAGYTVTPPPPPPWVSHLEVWDKGRREEGSTTEYADAQEALRDFLDASLIPGRCASLTHTPPSTT